MEFAMVYAVAPGAEYADWAKVGATQHASEADARKYLRMRYVTPYPEMRILHLCFVATHKLAAEAQVQAALAAFHATNEIYRGLGRGLDEALDDAFAAIAVPREQAAVAKLSKRKRSLMEHQNDRDAARAAYDAALSQRRAQETERIAQAAKEAAERAQETARVLERRRAAVEARKTREANKHSAKKPKVENRQEIKMAREKEREVAQDQEVDAWRTKHVQAVEGAWLVVKDAFKAFQAGGGKIGKTRFNARLKRALGVACFNPNVKVRGNTAAAFSGFSLLCPCL